MKVPNLSRRPAHARNHEAPYTSPHKAGHASAHRVAFARPYKPAHAISHRSAVATYRRPAVASALSVAMAVGIMAGSSAGIAAAAPAPATPNTLDLKVLVVGGVGGALNDPTTAAWESALTSRRCARTPRSTRYQRRLLVRETVGAAGAVERDHRHSTTASSSRTPRPLSPPHQPHAERPLHLRGDQFGVNQIDGYTCTQPGLWASPTPAAVVVRWTALPAH